MLRSNIRSLTVECCVGSWHLEDTRVIRDDKKLKQNRREFRRLQRVSPPVQTVRGSWRREEPPVYPDDRFSTRPVGGPPRHPKTASRKCRLFQHYRGDVEVKSIIKKISTISIYSIYPSSRSLGHAATVGRYLKANMPWKLITKSSATDCKLSFHAGQFFGGVVKFHATR